MPRYVWDRNLYVSMLPQPEVGSLFKNNAWTFHCFYCFLKENKYTNKINTAPHLPSFALTIVLDPEIFMLASTIKMMGVGQYFGYEALFQLFARLEEDKRKY